MAGPGRVGPGRAGPGRAGSRDKLFHIHVDRDSLATLARNNVSSELLNVVRGVPQGSVLSGLLFLIFINDIVNSSNLVHFNIFADDTSIYLRRNNIDDLYHTMNVELGKICCWISANKLALNVEKTVYILFKGKKSVPTLPLLHMFNSKIGKVDSTKFLGIYIDENLSWKTHANYVIGKLSRIIGIFYKIREYLPLSALKTLYFSFFQSSLQYGIIFWYFVSTDLRNKIIRLQKKVVRIILKTSSRAHTNELFKHLKILKFVDLLKLESCKFIHQDLNILNNFALNSYSLLHNYPTRQN